MSNVAQLWNTRCNQRLRRHWVSFSDRIVIAGEDLDQSGVLSVLPTGREGDREALRARLRVLGNEFEEVVTPGQDITIWIHGLELVVAVRAVEDERMLVEFGVPPGSKVGVTLDSGRAEETLRLA
jgi:hypothetical protein